MREGRFTLMGRGVSQGELVEAPLTNTKCLAFEVEMFEPGAEEPFGRLSGCSTFVLLVDGTEVTVQSGGAQVVVDLKGAEVIVDPEALWETLDRMDAKPSQYEGAWAEESCLLEGQRVFITGHVRLEVDSERSATRATYRSRLDERWVLGPERGKLAIHWQREHEPTSSATKERRAARLAELEERASWRGRVSPTLAWMQRHGVTCPHCELTAHRLRYVDDGFSVPFVVCPGCARSFEPPG